MVEDEKAAVLCIEDLEIVVGEMVTDVVEIVSCVGRVALLSVVVAVILRNFRKTN